MSDTATKTATAKASKPAKTTGTPGATGLNTMDYVPLPVPLGGGKVEFFTEPNSPWPDGYSLSRERAALADIMDAPDAEDDPRWDRLLEFEKREAQHIARQNAYSARNGAEAVVEYPVATSKQHLGSLVDEQRDTMTVHSMEAYRLFVGRAANAERNLAGIPGGKRQGAALRNLWMLTANSNPYAEWALLLHQRLHAEIRKRLKDEIAACGKLMEQQAARGLTIGLMRSSKPLDLELGFRSPYGYEICELIIDYDLMVRHVKTLQHKGQLKDEVARAKIRDVTRQIRAAWLQVVRFERMLSRDELRELSRADFLPADSDAHAEGAKRALAASTMFRGIPAAIFEGRMQPEHTKRREQYTSQELAVLKTAFETLSSADASGDAGATAGASEAPAAND